MQETPDPRHDRHVAFPDETTERLPESWWAPAPPPAPPPSPPPLALPRGRTSGRRNGWWAVGAVAMVGFLMSGQSVGSGSFAGGAVGEPIPAVEISSLPAEQLAPVQPTDVQTFVAPPGTTVYRLEVVGTDPGASLIVVAGSHDLPTDSIVVPFAAELTVPQPGDLDWITVHSSSGRHQIQCRLYAGENLIAIDTGQGIAECVPPGPP